MGSHSSSGARIALIAAGLAACGGLLAPPPVAAEDQVVDRIVAVVDEDPILLSDLQEVIGLGLAEPKPGEGEEAFRGRVLDGLIDERLRFHEVDRFGFAQVPVGEIEARVAEIRARDASPEAFAERLRDAGLSEAELNQLVARQLVVLTYVDERLGARVFVSLDDIRAYYQQTLVPKLEKDAQPVPPIEEVREQIRNLLKQQRLNEEIVRWTEELRRNADIQVFLDEPRDLPPVVERFDSRSPE